jgi:arylsulfatase A-like enzyme
MKTFHKLNQIALLAGSILPTGIAAAVPTAKPNIIFILVDDLGYGDLSCQGYAKDLHTPNIDRLLNQGVRFTNFYANCNVSSPSRAALLTGRYPDLVGVPGVIRTVLNGGESWGNLSSDAVLLPQTLKKAGYHTAIVGKWHLGLQSPDTPNERGFDYFHGLLTDGVDDYYTHLRHNINYLRENNTIVNPTGHLSEIFSDWAIEYVNSRKNGKDPFFLYLAFNAPHILPIKTDKPLQPPSEWLEKVKKREKNISENRAGLVALVEHLDEQIGRVVATLEANKQLDNTIIFFASDNGGDRPAEANNGLLHGYKGQMYEGGIRVAAGAYWKGVIKPAVTDNFAMLMDMFPTICQIAGAEIPLPVNGISILPVLLGEKQITDDRTVFWMRREGGNFGGRDVYAARYKNYKILQNLPYEPIQYFDLTADPKEQSPLTIETTDRFKQLSRELLLHIQDAGRVPWQ